MLIAAAAALALLAAGCGGSDAPSGPGQFFGTDVVARRGGGVLVVGEANTRRGNRDPCRGRLVVLALTASGERDTGYAAGGMVSRRLAGEDCVGAIEQAVGDNTGRAALEVTIDRPAGNCESGCSSHIPIAYVLSARGALTAVPGSTRSGTGSIALEPDGGLTLLTGELSSFPGLGPRAPVRNASAGVDVTEGGAVAVQPDGRMLVIGIAGRGERGRRVALGRLTAGLKPDPSWGRDGVAILSSDPRRPRSVYPPSPMDLLPDSRGGALAFVAPVTKSRAFAGVLLAFDASGRLRRGFGARGRVDVLTHAHDEEAVALAVAPDGRLLVSTATEEHGRCRRAVLELGRDGRPRRDFGRDGVAPLAAPCDPTSLAVARDGSLTVLVVADAGTQLFKLRADGSPDPAFGARGALRLRLRVAG